MRMNNNFKEMFVPNTTDVESLDLSTIYKYNVMTYSYNTYQRYINIYSYVHCLWLYDIHFLSIVYMYINELRRGYCSSNCNILVHVVKYHMCVIILTNLCEKYMCQYPETAKALEKC